MVESDVKEHPVYLLSSRVLGSLPQGHSKGLIELTRSRAWWTNLVIRWYSVNIDLMAKKGTDYGFYLDDACATAGGHLVSVYKGQLSHILLWPKLGKYLLISFYWEFIKCENFLDFSERRQCIIESVCEFCGKRLRLRVISVSPRPPRTLKA